MAPFESADEIAKLSNWHEFAYRLDNALNNKDFLGERSPGQVISEVSAIRGQSVVSTRLALRAIKFVKENYPDYAEPGSIHCGVTLVVELARIHSLSPERADKVADGVFSDRILLSSLRSTYAGLKEAATKETPFAVQRALNTSNAREFNKNIGQFTRWYVQHTAAEKRPQVKSKQKFGITRVDYAIYFDDKPSVIAEGKIFGSSAKISQIATTLGRIALLRGIVDEFWLCTPISGREILKEASEAAKIYRLDGVRYFAIDGFDEQSGTWKHEQLTFPFL